jgi:hypothetical protein
LAEEVGRERTSEMMAKDLKILVGGGGQSKVYKSIIFIKNISRSKKLKTKNVKLKPM